MVTSFSTSEHFTKKYWKKNHKNILVLNANYSKGLRLFQIWCGFVPQYHKTIGIEINFIQQPIQKLKAKKNYISSLFMNLMLD